MQVIQPGFVKEDRQNQADWPQEKLAEMVSEASEEVSQKEWVIFFRVKDHSAKMAACEGFPIKFVR